MRISNKMTFGSARRNTEAKSESGRLKLTTVLFAMIIAGFATFAFFGWKKIYNKFFETFSPTLEVVELPRGIGLAPVTLRIKLEDKHSGLDEVVIRAKQRNSSRELIRQDLGGQKISEINVEFPGQATNLDEGEALIEIRAFDRSFWSNTLERNIKLHVDFRKPRLQALSTQHNAVVGGSQLVIFKSADENLSISGVKVGKHTFLGFPARVLDEQLTDPALFAALYAIPLGSEEISHNDVRLFAEDTVGNGASSGFYNKVLPFQRRSTELNLSEEFLRGPSTRLADSNLERISRVLKGSPGLYQFQKPSGSLGRLLEKFLLVQEQLRSLNEQDISLLLQVPRPEKYWEPPFLKPRGAITGLYGDNEFFAFRGNRLGAAIRPGFTIVPTSYGNEVSTSNEGTVLYSGQMGVYGNTVIVSHGVGLTSLYSYLSTSRVSRGDSVTSGQVIGEIGQSGLTTKPALLFQMRLQGFPVNPREWWDHRWYQAHITQKVNQAKEALGISVLRPRGFGNR